MNNREKYGYIYANKYPEERVERGFAASAVHAVAVALDLSWESVHDSLVAQAHKLALMPADIQCVRAMLNSYGFFEQPESDVSTAGEIRAQMNKGISGAQLALVALRAGRSAQLTSLVPVYDEKWKQSIYRLCDAADHSNVRTNTVWLRWEDGEDHSPVKKRKRAFKTKSSLRCEGNECLEYFQPNPLNNSTGDCVVRAISAVSGISWHEAVDRLSSYGVTMINNERAYVSYLADNGFVEHKPILRENKRLSGKEFCQEMSRIYKDGERIFAYVGKCHCVAVMPFTQPDGSCVYKMMDSWDCTERKICSYWVGRRAHEGPCYSVGTEIVHPAFGTGTVKNIHGSAKSAVLEIEFPGVGIKKLSAGWVHEHCMAS